MERQLLESPRQRAEQLTSSSWAKVLQAQYKLTMTILGKKEDGPSAEGNGQHLLCFCPQSRRKYSLSGTREGPASFIAAGPQLRACRLRRIGFSNMRYRSSTSAARLFGATEEVNEETNQTKLRTKL
jgi:hypothetical protein